MESILHAKGVNEAVAALDDEGLHYMKRTFAACTC
jgi:hypothetical protein